MDPDQQATGDHGVVEGVPAEAGAQPNWASSFPGPELDELRSKLSDAPPTTAEAMADLLDAIGAEAGRLRATMLRMVSERLVAAEEEAARILKDAIEEAARTRSEAVRLMTERLEEAENTAEALRRTALADNLRAKRKALPLLTGAVAQVENLRDEIARLFDGADGLVPSLGQAAGHVWQLIGEVDAHFPDPEDQGDNSPAGDQSDAWSDPTEHRESSAGPPTPNEGERPGGPAYWPAEPSGTIGSWEDRSR